MHYNVWCDGQELDPCSITLWLRALPYHDSSLASVKKIPGEYLSGGCDSLSDLRGMTGLVAPGVNVGWSEAESFGCAESVDSVREMSFTRETDLVLWVGPS